MSYNIGDKIGIRTMEGLYLGEVTGVCDLNEDENIKLNYKVVYTPNFSKPLSREIRGLLLPQQRYEVLSFEEYLECQENDIKRRQNILNKLKETKND